MGSQTGLDLAGNVQKQKTCDFVPILQEWVKGKKVGIKLDDGKMERFTVDPFLAPFPSGGKGFRSPTKTVGKGIGTDRMIYRHIN